LRCWKNISSSESYTFVIQKGKTNGKVIAKFSRTFIAWRLGTALNGLSSTYSITAAMTAYGTVLQQQQRACRLQHQQQGVRL
jgi:hypothetical protein